ncbi:MAG: hypothetical protein KDI82_10125 [Gammaproteobacteria bacterium]|nr:hypothetical protein [Gammaproteobacteria bacterium]
MVAQGLIRRLALGLLCAIAVPAMAGQADVLKVEIRNAGSGSYDIDVTVRHADTGWDHYANRWEVIGPDGRVLATRVLYHPHVNEQPFTRSLSGVKIPGEFTWVRVRAHDLVHGHGGREVTLSVPRP